jgi:hypothetical protein
MDFLIIIILFGVCIGLAFLSSNSTNSESSDDSEGDIASRKTGDYQKETAPKPSGWATFHSVVAWISLVIGVFLLIDGIAKKK